MVTVGIVGGTGYTGVELIRILARHPRVNLEVITSRTDAGRPVASVYPSLLGAVDLYFSEPELEALAEVDVVFFATPNGIAMQYAEELLDRDTLVIDLAADFRLRDPKLWEIWYGMPHACPQLLSEAVYGLPELHREQIRKARLIACPGCYPTAVQLGWLPLLERGVIHRQPLVADCKSGVSGAGRQAKLATLMAETGESFKAYSVTGHRHHPEITQQLNRMAGEAVQLTFVPHLVPMIRGIHATLYAPVAEEVDFQALFVDRYTKEPFVDVLGPGEHPDTGDVRGANHCQIAVYRPPETNMVVVLSVIDNLVKGAAGQAVQNMNLACGFAETEGLGAVAMYP